MPSIALISPTVQYEIAVPGLAGLFKGREAAAIIPQMPVEAFQHYRGFAARPGKAPRTPHTVPGLACVADIDLKPEPRRRSRSFNQRDIARALRAAKAAGVEARVVIEAGRITLVPTKMVPAAN